MMKKIFLHKKICPAHDLRPKMINLLTEWITTYRKLMHKNPPLNVTQPGPTIQVLRAVIRLYCPFLSVLS